MEESVQLLPSSLFNMTAKALFYVSYMYGLILGGWQQLRLERHFGSMKHNPHCPHTVFLYCELAGNGMKRNEKKRKEKKRREKNRRKTKKTNKKRRR